VPAKLDSLVNELRQADREERVEILIDLAKALPPLPEALLARRDEAHRVPECVTPVFLFVEPTDGKRLRIFADVPVESLTVRGFVAMLVEGLDNTTAEEICATPNDLVECAGILDLIGMQRAAGLPGILRRLKSMAQQASAQPPKSITTGETLAPVEKATPMNSTESSAAEPIDEATAGDQAGRAPTPDQSESTPTAETVPIDQEAVVEALKTVKDPELHVNVIDLGLVYSMQTRAAGELDVEMTLTSPACPAGPQILRDAVTALEKIEGVSKANVRLVMSPPWTPDRMSDAARDQLGIF
jgi:metal-sulfur cluster biosynthetic enzyme/sulfur transfer protein SufE